MVIKSSPKVDLLALNPKKEQEKQREEPARKAARPSPEETARPRVSEGLPDFWMTWPKLFQRNTENGNR